MTDEDQVKTMETVDASQNIDSNSKMNRKEKKKNKKEELKKILEEVEPTSATSALNGMLSFFTIIKRPVTQENIAQMESHFWLQPIIGFIIGLVPFVICLIFGHVVQLDALITASLALISVLMFSKFIHFDGLQDFGDGLVCTGPPEKRVHALKDSGIGAGALGFAFCFSILTIAAYVTINSIQIDLCADYYVFVVGSILISPFALIAEILAKNSMVTAAVYGNPGNGMAQNQVRLQTASTLIKSIICTIVLLLVQVLLGFGAISVLQNTVLSVDNGFVLKYGTIVVITGLISSFVTGVGVAYIQNRKFGFVNGDCLGAANEIGRAISLIAIAFVVSLFAF